MEPGAPPTSPRHLVAWDAVRLDLDLDHLEWLLARRLDGSGRVRDLRLAGEGAVVTLTALVRWRSLEVPLAVRLEEVRLRHRHLGLRLRGARTAGGLPLPRGLLEMLVTSLGSDRVRLLRGQGIVVVDLRRTLPEALDLTVVAAQVDGRRLALWLAPGGLRELPHRRAELAADGDGPSPDASGGDAAAP